MAISYFPLTINVSQIVGKAVTNAVLTIGTNLPAGTPIAFGDEIAVPGGLYRLPGGVGSVNLPTKTGATNVSDWQYVVTGEYQLDGVVKRLAPVYIDTPTATTARNLASFIGVTSVPATFMGAAVAQIQAAGAAASAPAMAAKDGAVAARVAAEAAAANASSISLGSAEAALLAQIPITTTPIGGALNAAIGGQVSPLAFPGLQSLREAMNAGQSCAIQVLSDSTGNENWEWPYLVGQALAAKYPNYRVEWRFWTDAAQDIAIQNFEVIQNPGARYMSMAAGRYPRTLPTAYAPHLTGAIDARVTVNMADWTPGNTFGAEVLVGEGGGTGAWSWSFSVNSAGYLKLYYSENGTTLGSMQSSATHGIADGATATIRCVFIPNDGAGNRVAKFYKLAGSTWTQIGTTVTTAGAVTLFNAIAAGHRYNLGNHGAATNTSAVNIYDVEVRDGENGVDVVPRSPDVWASYGTGNTHAMVGPPVLTIVAGAHPGADLAYLGDATRLKRLTPDYGQVVTFLSCSHNQTRSVSRAWFAQYAAWVTAVRARLGTPIVAVTQNPQKGAAVYKVEQARRRTEVLGWARDLNVAPIDTYAAFLANPAWETAYMGDDVHPNAAGQAVWAAVVMAAFDLTS